MGEAMRPIKPIPSSLRSSVAQQIAKRTLSIAGRPPPAGLAGSARPCLRAEDVFSKPSTPSSRPISRPGGPWCSRSAQVEFTVNRRDTGKRCSLQPIMAPTTRTLRCTSAAASLPHSQHNPGSSCSGVSSLSRHDQCCESSGTLESLSSCHMPLTVASHVAASAVQSGPSHIEVIPRRSCSLRSMYGMSRVQRPSSEGVPR